MAYRKAQGPVEAEMTLLGPAMYPWPTGDFESARDVALDAARGGDCHLGWRRRQDPMPASALNQPSLPL
jgi:hypothetical protein